MSSENSDAHVGEVRHEQRQDEIVTQTCGSEATAADEHHVWGVSPPQIIQGVVVGGVFTQDQENVTVLHPQQGQDQSGSLSDTEALLLLNLEQDECRDEDARLKKERQHEGPEVSGSKDQEEEEEATQDRKEPRAAEEPDRQEEAQQEAQGTDSVQQAAKTCRKLRLFKPDPPSQETHARQTVKAPAPKPTQSGGSVDPKKKSHVPSPVPQLILPDSGPSSTTATREAASKARFESFRDPFVYLLQQILVFRSLLCCHTCHPMDWVGLALLSAHL
jgi:hypothetical protein